MKQLRDYIKAHWKDTIRGPEHEAFEKMPKPYITPCADEGFPNFFYWDTYFANLGLLKDGYAEQAKNNLEDMAFFIHNLGYMPNADQILFRSQPPLFTRGVYDDYAASGDKAFVKEMLPMILREFDFWHYDRNTSIGLNQYNTREPKQGRVACLEEFQKRVGENEEEKKLDQGELCKDFLSIAESGWDMTPRFAVPGNRFAEREFAPVDLNCILYDAEEKAAYLAKEIGEEETSLSLQRKAEERKEKIERYLKDKESGLYLDYNFKRNCFSPIHSCVSFYPYALGISKDQEGARRLGKELTYPYGLSAAPYRGKDDYCQWDYPMMWPSNVYFAYIAYQNLGLKEEAHALKYLYQSTVEKVFQATGKLWEKYDSTTGEVAVSKEYKTPTMMGWTAGVYSYLDEEE